MATNNKSNFRPDGNLDIQGNLTVRGNILGYGTTTFLNDTVTVNDADGYVINSDSDVDSSYLQLNSQTSNIRLTYNSANLTIGTTGVTNKIVLDANSNVEGTLTTTGNVTGPYFVGIATSAQKFTSNVNLTLDGDLTGSVSFEGPFTDSFAANINANAVILDYHTQGAYVKSAQGLSNSNIIVASQGTDDGSDITIDLVDTTVSAGAQGNATAVATYNVDSKGRLIDANSVMIAIPHSQVTDFNAAISSYITGGTGLTETSGTIDIDDTAVTAGAYGGNASKVSSFVVNQQGQLTDANTVQIVITSDQVSDFNANISTYITNGTYVTEANGVIDVTGDVVTTDRNDTLTADYVFSGNVDMTGIDAVAKTQSANDNSTKIATTAYVQTELTDLIGGAPSQLDTLREITDSLNNNTTVANTLVASVAAAEANIVTANTNLKSYTDNNKVDKTFIIETDGSIMPRVKLANGTVVDSNASSLGANASSNSKVISFQHQGLANIYLQTQKYDDEGYAVLHQGQQQVSGKITGNMVGNGSTSTVTATGHKLVSGDTITISNMGDSNAHGTFTVTKVDNNTFTVPSAFNGTTTTANASLNNFIDDNPTADFQKRDGNITFTGTTNFMQGRRSSEATDSVHTNQQGSRLGSGDVTFFSNVSLLTDANVGGGQLFSSNVTTVFHKGDAETPTFFGGTGSGFGIASANLFMFAHSSDVSNRNADSFNGTVNALVSANTIKIAEPRASRVTFEDSVLFVGGDIATYINAQTITANAGSDVYSVTSSTSSAGDALIERLTVDGAITIGNKASDTYHANGTIFYDVASNQFKGVEAGVVKTLVDATVNTIDLGSADVGTDANLMTQAANVFFPAGIKGDYGITVSRIANATANVAVIETSNADIRGLFSVSAGSQGYNSGTGVISVPSTSDHITEGTNLFYTDERVDDRVGALIVGGANITATYNDAAGTLTIDADNIGDVTGVTAGAGLTGGGTSGDVTLDVVGGTGITANANDIAITNTGVTAGVYGDANKVPALTVNAQGQITGAANTSINITASQVSDFAEAVDDQINVLVSGGSNITVTYDDAAGTFVIDNDLTGDVTGVVSGDGLSGGGTSGDVTLAVDSTVVRTSGNQSIAGVKTFTGDVTLDATSPTLTLNKSASSQSRIDFDNAGNIKARIELSADEDFHIKTGGTPTERFEITEAGVIKFNDAYTFPTSDGSANQVLATDGSGAISFQDVTAIGGTITGVNAGDGLTGGGVAGTVTLNVVGGDGITANANDIEVDSTVVRTSGAQSIAGEKTFSNNIVLGADLITGGNRITHSDSGTVSFLDFTKTLFSETNHTVLSSVKSIDFFLDSNGGDTGQAFRIFNNTNPDGSVTESNYIFKVSESGDVDVTGNLTVNGTQTIVNTETLTVDDNIIVLNNNESGTPSQNAGIEVERGTSTNVLFRYNEGSDIWQFTNDGSTYFPVPTSTSDLAEGTNQYFTNARARSAISVSGDLSYNSSTGVISFTNDAGDIESVTAGVGLSGGGSSGAVTLDLDFSELDDMTGTMDATDEFIILDSGTGEKRKAANEIGLSVFNNDSGFTTNVGDITGVTAGSGMTGGGTSGAVTLNVIGGDGITANADDVAIDLTDTTIFTTGNFANRAVVRDGSGNFAANVITATATSAQYADLAENYLADKPYEPGTVLVIGGSAEVTEVTKQNSPAIAGVVSTEPAHLMNSALEGDNVVAVALKGRVPVKVVGAVRKGDVLIASNTPGHAQAAPFNGYHAGASAIGVAISENLTSGTGVVEALIK